MKPEEILPILENGVKAGCTEALFTFGELPEEVPEYRRWLKELGYSSTLEYLLFLCEAAIDIGILPHTNAGIMTRSELKALKPLNASMGLMLESTAALDAHKDCPGKLPELGLKLWEARLRIPYYRHSCRDRGERRQGESLEAIAGLHREYGHIQEVIIQFYPKIRNTYGKLSEPAVEKWLILCALPGRSFLLTWQCRLPKPYRPKALVARG